MHLQYMTTLTNIEILAQLGWTMELMHNSTGGRLPRFWRPPYGDTDIRVHAIAKEIFGLTGILWNQEYVYVLSVMHRRFIPRLLSTNDWMLPTGTTLGAINASMTKWLTGKYLQLCFFGGQLTFSLCATGPKNPGLIILEHELTNQSVEAFISAYPVMKANGWNITSTAQLAGNVAYQNAGGSTDPVTPADGVILGDINSSEAPTTTATATR
jgi:peptidoglycan/xylan/chitin deacetylase (PgdA/CDA1 family)